MGVHGGELYEYLCKRLCVENSFKAIQQIHIMSNNVHEYFYMRVTACV